MDHFKKQYEKNQGRALDDKCAIRRAAIGECLWGIFVCLVFLAILAGGSYVPLKLHKNAMERMVGHPVSWWDAFWTS